MSSQDTTNAAGPLTFSDRIAAVFSWTKAASGRLIWPGVALAFAVLFTIAVIRPFDRRDNLNADDVAAAWIGSIGRLGIIPVFPPSEDIQVGDLWAVIADADDKLLLNKAVRIAHIDLREDIAADAIRPIFPDTVELQQGQTFRHQDYTEVKPTKSDQILPSIAAFPGITITHSTKATASSGFGWGIFSGGRDDDLVEEIQIPSAETYGAPAVAAFGRLNLFCADNDTRIYCTDEFVRRALAYVTDDRVLAAPEGRYLARLQISLVIRTYSTREIQQKRAHKDSRSGQLSTTADSPTSGSATAPANGSTENGETLPPRRSAAGGPNSAIINASRADETQLALKQVFQRPVVFGFRAVTIALTPSTPQQEKPLP